MYTGTIFNIQIYMFDFIGDLLRFKYKYFLLYMVNYMGGIVGIPFRCVMTKKLIIESLLYSKFKKSMYPAKYKIYDN